MISRKTLRIAGAAILGTFVGTGSAHAVVYMDGDDLEGQISYALEGISTEYDGDGLDNYYVFPDAGTNRYDVQFPLGLDAPPSTDVILEFTLENMVFGGAAGYMNTDLTVQAAGDRNTDVTGSAVVAVHQTGGSKGSTSLVYSISRATGRLSEEMYVTLAIHDVAIGLDATGGTGTVTMRARRTISGTEYATTPMSIDMIKVEPAYESKANPSSPQAAVDTNYTGFGGTVESPTKVASIGSLDLGVKEGDHFVLKGAVIDTAAALLNPGRIAANIVMSGTVTLGGGSLSFLKDVFLSTSAGCSQLGTPVSFVTDTDPGEAVNLEWKTGNNAISVGEWFGALNPSADNNRPNRMYICIEADDDATIPVVTSNYTASVSLVPIEDAAYPVTPTSEVLTLGAVGRGGTDVHIPYLTTFGSYNQRIVMTNRTANPVGYSMSFDTEAGVTASAGDGATGTLPADSVTVVRARDAVTIEGGSRVAASVNIQAPPTEIEVATVQVNTSNGSTDTVVYRAAD